MRVAEAAWSPYRRQFSQGIADWLKRNGGFAAVLPERPVTLPKDSIILNATITRLDMGNPYLRRILGWGAVEAAADVEIQDSDGAVLATFSVGESYRGDAGAREVGALVIRRLGEKAADAARRWARGGAPNP